jgi:AbrB family looped-hinge helix DNA binding protein
MNAQTRVSSKGQIVIPKDVRDRLNIAAGDRLEVVERLDGVLLRKSPPKLVKKSFEECVAAIRQIIRYDGPPVSIDDMNESIADMWKSGGPKYK